MELENRIKALIAVGASITANCQPCLTSTAAMAFETGANEQEIKEAIEVGKRVRGRAASKMDNFLLDLNYAVPISETTKNVGCECALSAKTTMEGKNG
jgi:AhpD family alkylhydroperoxidase